LGVAAALALTRLVKSMLYGVQPWDPATLAAGALLLLGGGAGGELDSGAAGGGRAADGCVEARVREKGLGIRVKR
jgi:hypothetical protein